MKASPKALLPLLFIVLLISGCGGPSPSKEQLVADLKTIYEAVSKNDNATAAEHFIVPEGASQEKVAKNLGGLIRKKEISAEGIEVLDQKGKFGKLNEVFPEKGPRWCERSKIDSPENCYALGYERAEVAAYWDGSKFLFFRLDDVGKL